MSPIDSALLWCAAAGACLALLGLRWGVWLTLPAALRFLAWPLAIQMLPAAPWWLVAFAALLLPVVLAILALRGGQAVLQGVFGKDVAVRVVSRALIAIFGSFFGAVGRVRARPLPAPALPRPGRRPVDLRDFDQRRGRGGEQP